MHRSLSEAIAILIGFSWEHSFEEGVAAVASTANHKRRAVPLLFVPAVTS